MYKEELQNKRNFSRNCCKGKRLEHETRNTEIPSIPEEGFNRKEKVAKDQMKRICPSQMKVAYPLNINKPIRDL